MSTISSSFRISPYRQRFDNLSEKISDIKIGPESHAWNRIEGLENRLANIENQFLNF